MGPLIIKKKRNLNTANQLVMMLSAWLESLSLLSNSPPLDSRYCNLQASYSWHSAYLKHCGTYLFFKKGENNDQPNSKTEKAMAPHSSTLAWKIPWTEEPSRLQSMGLLRVGQDWATSLSLFTFMHWRRKWQPTPVFLPGESQRRGSLVGCRLWGRTESDTTEVT